MNFSRVQWDLEVHEGAYRKIAGRPEHNWVWSPQGIIDMHRPEMWGELEFVETGAGQPTGRVAPDVLDLVYYAQAAYRARFGMWANELSACGLAADVTDGVVLKPTPDGWQATAMIDGKRRTIRHDSLRGE